VGKSSSLPLHEHGNEAIAHGQDVSGSATPLAAV
jgi:hypothetical protein